MAGADDASGQVTLNIPSLVAFAVISFFTIRYFFFSGPAPAPAQPAAPRQRRVPLAKIDTVATMFPQLARRDVEWDLLRNGASVQATTERVLREGRLPAAPPNFQAQATQAAPAPVGAASAARPKTQHPDLITRYNLAARLVPASAGAVEDALQSTAKQRDKGGWSANKDERAALLKRRREEMVLAARRKLEQRELKGKERAD